jgi:hypothetical protein
MPNVTIQGAALPFKVPAGSPATPEKILKDAGFEGAAATPNTLKAQISARMAAVKQAEQEGMKLLHKPRRRSYAVGAVGVQQAARIPGAHSTSASSSEPTTRAQPGTGSPATATTAPATHNFIRDSRAKTGMLEYEVDKFTGQVRAGEARRLGEGMGMGGVATPEFMRTGSQFKVAAPATVAATRRGQDGNGDFLATLCPGGVVNTGETGSHLPSSITNANLYAVEPSEALTYSVRSYLKQFKEVKRVKEAVFHKNGVHMTQVVQQMSEAILDDMTDDITAEMETFFEDYADQVLRTL